MQQSLLLGLPSRSKAVSSDACHTIAESFVVLRSRCLLKPVFSLLEVIDQALQIVFLDALLDLVTDHLGLVLEVQFLLVCVSLGTRLHLLHIDTLHLRWKIFACHGSMGNPLDVSI